MVDTGTFRTCDAPSTSSPIRRSRSVHHHDARLAAELHLAQAQLPLQVDHRDDAAAQVDHALDELGRARHLGDLADADDLLDQPHVDAVLLACRGRRSPGAPSPRRPSSPRASGPRRTRCCGRARRRSRRPGRARPRRLTSAADWRRLDAAPRRRAPGCPRRGPRTAARCGRRPSRSPRRRGTRAAPSRVVQAASLAGTAALRARFLRPSVGFRHASGPRERRGQRRAGRGSGPAACPRRAPPRRGSAPRARRP